VPVRSAVEAQYYNGIESKTETAILPAPFFDSHILDFIGKKASALFRTQTNADFADPEGKIWVAQRASR